MSGRGKLWRNEASRARRPRPSSTLRPSRANTQRSPGPSTLAVVSTDFPGGGDGRFVDLASSGERDSGWPAGAGRPSGGHDPVAIPAGGGSGYRPIVGQDGAMSTSAVARRTDRSRGGTQRGIRGCTPGCRCPRCWQACNPIRSARPQKDLTCLACRFVVRPPSKGHRSRDHSPNMGSRGNRRAGWGADDEWSAATASCGRPGPRRGLPPRSRPWPCVAGQLPGRRQITVEGARRGNSTVPPATSALNRPPHKVLRGVQPRAASSRAYTPWYQSPPGCQPGPATR